MLIRELFVAQLDREAVATHRVLERVPEARNDWRPHEKSMPLGYLAALCAILPGWIEMMVEQPRYDLLANHPSFHPRPRATTAELLKALDNAVERAHKALAGRPDEHFLEPWRLCLGDRVVSEVPRHVSVSDAVFSHLSHHRGQLTVYLRLLDRPVPGIFGPSADDNPFA